MIYFDNAATTYPKPVSVANRMQLAMLKYGGNPGRSGHDISSASAEAIFEVRQKAADMFGCEVENCVFTHNCTSALNAAIKGLMSGGHIITSDMEHNSVIRPIYALEKKNIISFSVARVEEDDEKTINNFISKITPYTRAIACTLASNVTGKEIPYKKIGKICSERNICFIADGAQVCGAKRLNLKEDNINILCCAGHKGLYGPMGTGMMLSDGKYKLDSTIDGGTGSVSSSIEMPDFSPDRFEAGTPNTPGILGLGAGIDFVLKMGEENIYNYENKLKKRFLERIQHIDGIRIYTSENGAPIVSFNLYGVDSAEFAEKLNKAGFALRGGLHCSFLMHTKIGTIEQGTVRFAPSVMNTQREVDMLAFTIKKLSKEYKKHL